MRSAAARPLHRRPRGPLPRGLVREMEAAGRRLDLLDPPCTLRPLRLLPPLRVVPRQGS